MQTSVPCDDRYVQIEPCRGDDTIRHVGNDVPGYLPQRAYHTIIQRDKGQCALVTAEEGIEGETASSMPISLTLSGPSTPA
jgi:hypothetical protein